MSDRRIRIMCILYLPELILLTFSSNALNATMRLEKEDPGRMLIRKIPSFSHTWKNLFPKLTVYLCGNILSTLPLYPSCPAWYPYDPASNDCTLVLHNFPPMITKKFSWKCEPMCKRFASINCISSPTLLRMPGGDGKFQDVLWGFGLPSIDG